VPVAVAAAWVSVRSDLPNTDVALLLVLCVGAVALVGGRVAVLIGSLAGATAFDFFDTPPYGQLFMTRGRDVATTLVLIGASLLVGELALRLGSYRTMATRRGEDFTVMTEAAQLMSFGDGADMVVAALAGELASRLGLADCRFERGPPAGDRPCVARDGRLVDLGERSRDQRITTIDLPVWTGIEVVGRYRMTLRPGPAPDHERLVAAVGIAEQAGAALAGSWPRPPTPVPTPTSNRPRRLRLVR
jgi:Domain of unknown function (DUF4118)